MLFEERVTRINKFKDNGKDYVEDGVVSQISVKQ